MAGNWRIMVDHVESPIVEKCRELIETHQDHKAKVRLQLFYCDLLPSGKLGVTHHLTCIQIGLVNNMLENSQTEEQLENLRDCSWNGSGWPSCLCEWLHLNKFIFVFSIQPAAVRACTLEKCVCLCVCVYVCVCGGGGGERLNFSSSSVGGKG